MFCNFFVIFNDPILNILCRMYNSKSANLKAEADSYLHPENNTICCKAYRSITKVKGDNWKLVW